MHPRVHVSRSCLAGSGVQSYQGLDAAPTSTPLYKLHPPRPLPRSTSQSYRTRRAGLTARTRLGRPHSVLSRRRLCNRPRLSTPRSSTSTPTTQGFIGFGYFLMAALITVSHGWLQGECSGEQRQGLHPPYRQRQWLCNATRPRPPLLGDHPPPAARQALLTLVCQEGGIFLLAPGCYQIFPHLHPPRRPQAGRPQGESGSPTCPNT